MRERRIGLTAPICGPMICNGDAAMRTTYDLPDELVQQAMAVSGAKTKREAIEMFGKTPMNMTADDLLRLREMDMPKAPTEQPARRPQVRANKTATKVAQS